MSPTATAAPAAASLWRGLGGVPAAHGPCVLTMGVFDGIHRGHAKLIDRAVELGVARGLPAVLLTFDPHPARVLGLPKDVSELTTVERRAELAFARGIAAVTVLPFDRALAQLAPARFVDEVVAGVLRAEAVVVGGNFTFGHRAAGDLSALRALGAARGFTAHGAGLLQHEGRRCSSSAVREHLRRGAVEQATQVLGRPHRVAGMLYPDGELRIRPGIALPAPGRYAGASAAGTATRVEVRADGRVRLPDRPGKPEPAAVDFLESVS